MIKWMKDDVESEYFKTFEGQFEYCLMEIVCEVFKNNMNKFPPFWYGAYNEICLYMRHPSYSPFLDNSRYADKKMPLTWNMRNVPFGQEGLVDNNFIPKMTV